MQPLTPVKIIRNYEGVVILDADTTEDQQKAIFRRNRDIIQRFDGEINHLDTWGRRKLANQIRKRQHAIYFHTTFTATPEAVSELERTMRIDEKVLRFMHTRLDDRTNLTKYVEEYKQSLAEAAAREKEREAKAQKKKAMRAAGGRSRH